MNPFDSVSVLADLIFGLVMLVYGFAGGLFVAGWVLAKAQKPEGSPVEYASHSTGQGGRKSEGGK